MGIDYLRLYFFRDLAALQIIRGKAGALRVYFYFYLVGR